jgi:hypothetical protein
MLSCISTSSHPQQRMSHALRERFIYNAQQAPLTRNIERQYIVCRGCSRFRRIRGRRRGRRSRTQVYVDDRRGGVRRDCKHSTRPSTAPIATKFSCRVLRTDSMFLKVLVPSGPEPARNARTANVPQRVSSQSPVRTLISALASIL